MTYIDGIVMAMLGGVSLWLYFWGKKAVSEKKEAEGRLSKALGELEAVYSEVKNTQEELNIKYREIKASEDMVKKLAYEDGLTGMPNRAAFYEVLKHTLETLRKNEFAGVMYVDLDDFKKMDDLWGHAHCDEFILDVSHRLRQNLNEDDYIARMDGDGDGFMILSQNLSGLEEYDEKIKRLLNSFRFPFITSFGEAIITLSIGATMVPNDGEKVDVLLKNASLALAEAKKLGKNTYVYYYEDLTLREIEMIEFKSSLSSAIKQDAFLVKYEPIIDIKEKRCDMVRVKLLWDRKEKGVLHASEFFDIVETLGGTAKVGMNVLNKICKEMILFPDKKVILPLTEKLFFDYEFTRQMMEIIEEHRIDGSRFLLEIEESILTERFEDSLFVMEEFLRKGYGFVAGNYGSGKRSLDIIRDMELRFLSLSIPRVFADHNEEEAKAYLALLYKVVKEMGAELLFVSIEDSVYEDYVIECGGSLVSGELFGGYLTGKEVAETLLFS